MTRPFVTWIERGAIAISSAGESAEAIRPALVVTTHPAASELDTLDPPGSREKIALPDFALTVAAPDKSDVVTRVEHDVSPQKGLWPLDRTCFVHRDIVEFGTGDRLRLCDLHRRWRRRRDLLLELIDACV